MFLYIWRMIFGPFANNWWSKRWLSTLLANAADRDLEVGLRYANRKQVIKLEVIDHRVVAEVLGPNGGHHNCYMVFPKFPVENSEIFLSVLKRQPAELMAISNDSLNASIELILSRCGLKIFDEFSDITVECDCKNAEPCGLTVAVLLNLAHIIDEDPCALFKLHGLDLSSLKNYKAETLKVEVPKESGLFRIKSSAEARLSLQQETDLPFPEFKFLSWTDYSKILPSLLAPNPRFCPGGNFKKTFCDEIERVHEKFDGYFSFGEFAEDYHCNFAKVPMDPMRTVCLRHTQGWGWLFSVGTSAGSREVAASKVISTLCSLDASGFELWNRNVQFLYVALKVAFYLVRTCAIYPQVFWLNENTAQVRWLPADMLPEILSAVTSLDAVAPSSIVTTGNQIIYDQTEHLLSVFINELLAFVRRTCPHKHAHDNLLGFFFECRSGKSSNVKIPTIIQEWFAVYSTFSFKTEIWLVCSESSQDIALEVFIKPSPESAVREPLSKLFEENDSRLLTVLNVLNSALENFVQLKDYIECKGKEPVILHGQDLLDFLKDSLPKIQTLGIKVDLPKSLLEIKKPRSRISVRGGSIGTFSAKDLLDFDWEVAVGDESISAKEFLKLAEAADGLLKIKSQYVEFTKEDLEKLKKQVDEGVDNAKLVQACLTGEYHDAENGPEEFVPITLTPELRGVIDSLRDCKDEELPEGLNATLRPYQERGYSWLCNEMRMGFGCILADDMGLGKTLQVIAFLLKLKNEFKLEERKVLVVVPAALLYNWQVEVKKFAPSLSVFPYHGGMRDLLKFKEDILITTYGTFRRDYKKLQTLEWEVIVIDEAQNIKNFDTNQSRLLRSMKASMKIAMSGTPVENRLMEFWTIMDFCNRGILLSQEQFRTEYETPIQKNKDEAAAERFKRMTAPFMLRRLKTDKSIISDLPDKIIQDEYVELTKSQAMLYKKALDHFMAELEAAKLAEQEDDSHALFKRKGLILQMILALKQICNHPKTFFKRDIAELLPETDSKNHSFADDSGKIQMLLELLKEIQETEEKTLIFTQFAEMGELLKQVIHEELGIETEFYHGGLSQTQRKKMVEEFQQDPEKKILILSLKAGGTGLNLTAASQVIHYDLWWNPAIEAQATDRAFRIGQKRNVQVHRLITKGTFEEKINALLESKKAIANLTVNVGETWLTDLSDKELGEVFGLELGV